MECNKEEAIRAMSIAENKMQSKDFIGARKIALKAQQLFPDLENISRLLSVCEVHCSAAKKVNDSEDWYGILQVEPTADELSIKKQYRMFALLLHPDKNKFAGAEAAFKLIGEAHRTLSDRGKRSLYDMKRISMKMATSNMVVQHPNRNSYVNMQPGVANKFNGGATMQSAWNEQKHAPQPYGLQTFWTSCPHCCIKYQYYRTMLNRPLRCQSCLGAFTAYDIHGQGVPVSQPAFGHKLDGQHAPTGPTNIEQTAYGQNSHATHQNNVQENSSTMRFQENAGGGFACSHRSRTANGSTVKGKFHCKRKDGSQVNDDTLNKGKCKSEKINLKSFKIGEQTEEISGKLNQKRRRRRGSLSSDTDSNVDDDKVDFDQPSGNSMDMGATGNLRRSTRHKQNVIYNEDQNVVDDNGGNLVSSPERARKGRLPRHADVHTEAGSNESEISASKHENQKSGGEKGQVMHTEKISGKKEKKSPSKEDSMACEEGPEMVAVAESRIDSKAGSDVATSDHNHISCPDPEFHDFEKNRVSSLFSAGQIWALYDDMDAMPRFYAQIREVETGGFNVHFTWLECVASSQATMMHSSSELPIGCGYYRLGDSETSEERTIFSHMMPWEKGTRNTYIIWPKRGQVWALYKNGNVELKSETNQQNLFEYDIVEVLSDYAAESGISVVHLIKVKGFVSVFTRRNENVHLVLPNEIFRFSHLIPYYKLTGNEREGIPNGCYELDPACLPPNFEKILPSASFSFINAEVEQTDTKSREKGYSQKGDALQGTREKCRDNDRGGHHKATAEEGNNAKDEVGTSKCLEKEMNFCPTNANGANYTDNNSCSPSSSEPSLGYPSPEFYTFEFDKSPDKFQCGQIWALYSDIDAFPKYYALITDFEKDNFKVHVSWLEACPVGKVESNWLKKMLPFGCGRFRLLKGKKNSETYDKTRVFSHIAVVESTQMRYHYDIYPNSNEIWALYSNWNPDWGESDIDKCDYDLVEIVSRTNTSIKANLLVKVSGFTAVFMRKKDDNGITITMEVPKSEKLRFSHLVPSFQLTEERGGKLRGFWELDPASVPEIFLCSNDI